MFRSVNVRAGAVFFVVIIWKLLLLIITAQPLPFGDSFFYDGPVVNLINGGAYANPALELVLPISATKVFSAYPPLYQLVLWVWMSVFGPSALTALWLHLVLFAVYGLGLLAIFRHLKLPAFCINLGCLFLFGITYHDRPDSLGFAFGIWAIYLWLRALDQPANSRSTRWHWGGAGLNVLTVLTSLQWGLLFFGWATVLVVLLSWSRQQAFPKLTLATAGGIPVLLLLYVKNLQPEIWSGFQEHLHQAPNFLGWRAADAGMFFRSQILKLGRYAPAIFLSAICFGWLLIRSRHEWREWPRSSRTSFLTGALLVAGLVVVASTLMLAMIVHGIGYLQVILVAGTTAWLEQAGVSAQARKLVYLVFFGLALIVGTRAIGLSTWGVANARDVSYGTAISRVHAALETCPAHSTIVASAAFLYEANSFRNLRALHVDWLSSFRQPRDPYGTLVRIRPQKLVLTQFDWYRNLEPVVASLKQQSNLVELTIVNMAQIRPPDAYPQFQRILQHVSWAPVIVEFEWKTNGADVPKSVGP